jgi:ABC-2 type transport system permease protein
MSWQKVWLVLRREYTYNFKRPSFLFTAFGIPVISLGAMFLIIRFTADRETNLDNFQTVGYIDRAGAVQPGLELAQDYAPVVDPALELPAEHDTAALDRLEAYAQQQVHDKALDAFFVIREDYVLTGRVDVYAIKNIPQALHDDIESFMAAQIAALAPGTLVVGPSRLSDPAELTIRDTESGEELTDAQLIGRLILPFIFVFIYFMGTNTTAQFMMSGVVEEKENRLMEILATSVRPIELLWGKMLGLGALSLTQVALWAIAGLLIASQNKDAGDFLSGASFRPGDLALMMGLFLINFFLCAASMLAIGASVTAEAESRQIAGIFTFVLVIPLALIGLFLNNPDGTLPVFFTFFPFTAAIGLILRLGLTTLPAWQIVLSVAIQVATTLVVIWLAAKIFRLGMLMYGKPLTPRTLWHALREGRTTLTTAQSEPGVTQKKRSLWR